MPFDLQAFLVNCQNQVNSSLKDYVTTSTSRLHNAMHYSVFNGGKRIRPALCYATANLFNNKNPITDKAACAVELIHAYSLIHDDLPAMDDDDLRRGKPTCHIAYDEATAILAGDGLQALAFSTLCPDATVTPDQSFIYLSLLRLLCHAAGSKGMVLGQAIDLDAVNQQLSIKNLEIMHRHKTGALINASVLMGAVSAGCDNQQELQALRTYSDAIGLAFQVQDDILDEESITEKLGKRQGADHARNKPTYTSLLGLDGAREKLNELHQRSISALAPFGSKALPLQALADFIVSRDH